MDLVHNSTALDFQYVPAKERPEVFGSFIRVTNSYNGLRAHAFDIGFFRKVCKNGLISPATLIRFRFSHLPRDIGDTFRFEIAHDRLVKFKASFADYLGALRTCSVPHVDFAPFVCGVLSIRKPEKLETNTRAADEWTTLSAHIGELSDPVGPENDHWLSRLADEAGIIIAAWGIHGGFMQRDSVAMDLLGDLRCLGLTKCGRPRYPPVSQV
jgi:hypothetical protein